MATSDMSIKSEDLSQQIRRISVCFSNTTPATREHAHTHTQTCFEGGDHVWHVSLTKHGVVLIYPRASRPDCLPARPLKHLPLFLLPVPSTNVAIHCVAAGPFWPVGTLRCPSPSREWVRSAPSTLCFLDLNQIISRPAEILSIILPLGVYFASDRNMASSPRFHPSLPFFSGTCQH